MTTMGDFETLHSKSADVADIGDGSEEAKQSADYGSQPADV